MLGYSINRGYLEGLKEAKIKNEEESQGILTDG